MKIPKTDRKPTKQNEIYEAPKNWYTDSFEEPANFDPVSEQILIDLKDEARRCLDQLIQSKVGKANAGSRNKWMTTMMSGGTVSDKIAAHALTIQDNPLCSLETLQNLIALVKVGKKRECFTVMETLTDLFLTYLLKPRECLKVFDKRPLSLLSDLCSGDGVKRRKMLALWYFEDQLKEIFHSFLKALNAAAQDTVEKNKEKALTAMFKLLVGNPEQEKILLASIVNKLGDPSQKVASKAIYCLTQLLIRRRKWQSNKQEMVLIEVERLLFRPNISGRAQYYCLCFLSQFYLNHDEPEVAKKLIQLYLAFFKACVKKGDVDSRMMSAILMGINRAYPYSKMEFDDMAEHVDTLYRLVHLGSFNVSVQVLALLQHVTLDKMADRFYGALYRKLSDPRLLNTSHQAMLLSLVYKAVKKDTQVNRVKTFVKRLLQVSLFVQPAFCCAILYTASQLIGKNGDLRPLILKQTELRLEDDDGDDEEKYYDIKDENDATETPSEGEKAAPPTDVEEEEKPDPELLNASLELIRGPGWCHRDLAGGESRRPRLKYNPLARNPLYGGGEFCAYTELLPLARHFHPTVSLYAKNLLEGAPIKYSGDPLKDFTLIRFLERFVFKNPKKSEEKPGIHPTLGARKFYKPRGVKLLPVRSKNYMNADTKSIPVEELFLYSYLQRRYQHQDLNEEEDSDLESVGSDEFEEMLDKMAGADNAEEADIDFMPEMGKVSGKTKRKADDGGDSDLEPNDEDLDLMDDLEDDEEEDMEFAEDDAKGDVSALFASAEEFASLLEEEGASKQKPGSSNALQNEDAASRKQIAWEEKRNRWIQGFDRTIKKRPRRDRSFREQNKKLRKL
ncbi:CCAAT/enhancer-binding protein zeta [Cylas formicarius]|uniref:CCAAT/enhancer-binding protein zeta n=1 Tax=Cylas formicarius TaxID=197179 RepID=UPI00295859C7|nr:CCAAT/enhancer-binding protein zeta [Cylas formicarius]